MNTSVCVVLDGRKGVKTDKKRLKSTRACDRAVQLERREEVAKRQIKEESPQYASDIDWENQNEYII